MNDTTFINRSMKTSLIVGAILFVFLSQRFSLSVLWGSALGVLLSVLNLFLLSRFLEIITSPLGADRKRMAVFYAVLKFPIFYSLLLFPLFWFNLSVYAFMAGFSVPLFVIVMKTVGKFQYKDHLNGGIAIGE